MDCLFCKIVAKDIPSDIIFENEKVMAFSDINPQAPTHKLIIPKTHIATINDLSAEHSDLVWQLYQTAKTLAKDLGIAKEGYRVVMNCNPGGGQEVYHIHLHLLGGRQMNWPPG